MSKRNVIDSNTLDALKELMGDSFDFLIATFINDTGKLIHSLSELQQQNKLKVFTRNAHSIKSSSANIGALQLSSIADHLEILGKNGDISNVSTLIKQLKTAFTDACNELGAVNQPPFA